MTHDDTPERRCSWCSSTLVTATEFGFRCLQCTTETYTEEMDR
ncbi:hypothetical protein ACI3EY_17060 [Ornithinimicrobium sp. LYQ92]